MNKHIIVGNLTKDVEMRSTNSGKSVASFTVATQRKRANADGERQADFHSVIAWGTLADNCGMYLSKGKKVCVVGEVQHRSYMDNGGVKHYVTETVADEVEFLTPKGDSKPATDTQQPAPQQAAQPEPQQGSLMAGFTDISNDDIPF